MNPQLAPTGRPLPKTPITEQPPYEPAYEPFLKVGSLVTLKTIEQNHIDNIPFWRSKTFALVQEVFWDTHDRRWDEDYADPYEEEPCCVSVPSTTLLWNDGETTNTTQNALKVISENSP